MSTYFDKRKKFWRYEFQYKKNRYTKSGFKTKKAAAESEAERRKELKRTKENPIQDLQIVKTDMAFLDLINKRLDYIKAYESEKYYEDTLSSAKRWVRQWGEITCGEISGSMIQSFMINLKENISAFTANKDLRYLRAAFNFAKNKPNEWIDTNPTEGIGFFPIVKKKKKLPSKKDILSVIMAAEPDTQDYLWTIVFTLGRVSEINKLTWDDVDFDSNCVTLYTRKKRGGHLTPRDIPMCTKLKEILWRRFQKRNRGTPYVFWHEYYSRKQKCKVVGRYQNRKKIMKTLCEKAGVGYFRFHPLRHFGASWLEKEGTSIKVIQEILGHENRATTEIYLHSFSESGREAMNTLEDAFIKSPTPKSHTKQKKVSGESPKPLLLVARPERFERPTP